MEAIEDFNTSQGSAGTGRTSFGPSDRGRGTHSCLNIRRKRNIDSYARKNLKKKPHCKTIATVLFSSLF